MRGSLFDIGYLRWSSLAAVFLRSDEPQLKLARKEAMMAPSVVVLGNHTVSGDDLTALGNLRQRLLATIEAGDTTAPLFVAVDARSNLLSVSFVDFSETQGTLPPAAHLTPLLKLPACIRFGTDVVRIVLEERMIRSSFVAGAHLQERDAAVAPAPPPQPPGTRYPRVLMIGAGGIGCELIKCITLCGVRSICIVDLDTIDATNLNRQFLFRRDHINQSKSAVAAMVMQSRIQHAEEGLSSALSHHDDLQPSFEGRSIRGMCSNVKDNSLDASFYKEFDIVLNGLDNMSARKHVNRMCMVAGVPMIESGTMGFNGQVQPIVKGVTECYDCRPKPADQPSFAVCTIHARPTSMVHCVHYAKELYDRMLSTGRYQDDARGAGVSGGGEPAVRYAPASEVDAAGSLFAEAHNRGVLGCAQELFKCLFVEKIQSLLSLHGDGNSWPHGAAPNALLDVWHALRDWETELIISSQAATLRDVLLVAEGQIPTAEDSALLLLDSFRRLVERRRDSNAMQQTNHSGFSKDDDDALVFVAAVANLRSTCFHIPRQGLEDLRSIAGNIVPAIASSNAIIAACVAAQALTLLQGPAAAPAPRKGIAACGFVYLRKAPLHRRRRRSTSGGRGGASRLLLHTCMLEQPNPQCMVCSHLHVTRNVSLNVSLHTVRSLVDVVLRGHFAVVSPCLSLGSHIVFEHEEFETLASRPLEQFFDDGLNGSPKRATFIASDLNQQLEWSLCVHHDASIEDEISFTIDGVLYGTTPE